MTAKPMDGQTDTTDDLIAELAKLMAQDAKADHPADQARPSLGVRIPGGAPVRGHVPQSRVAPSVAPVLRSQPAEPTTGEGRAVASAMEPGVTPEHDGIADLIAAELAVTTTVAIQSEATRASPEVTQGNGHIAENEPLGEGAAPDNFRPSPIFDPGGKTAAVKASVVPEAPVAGSMPPRDEIVSTAPGAADADDHINRNPIDEIENLIGRAVHVELELPVVSAPNEADDIFPTVTPHSTPSAALRSLATPVLPDEAAQSRSPPRSEQQSRHELNGVDEAILAAATAGDVQVGWVNGDESGAIDAKSRIRATRGVHSRVPRAIVGPLVAMGLLVIAGIGLYWVLGQDSSHDPAPLLLADNTPVKEVPVAQDSTAPQSIVFNEIDGVGAREDEQLVSRDQTDVNEIIRSSDGIVSQNGLANRRVRTVTVRPDGTIVSNDEGIAGNSILPVDRPNVPVVPGASLLPELESADLTANAREPVLEPIGPPEPAVILVTPGTTVPAVDVAGNAIPGKMAVIPRQKPVGLAQASAPIGPASESVDAVINAPGPSLVPSAQTVTGGIMPDTAPAYVQLASQRSEADARQTIQALVRRYGPLFNGVDLEVQRVDLGTRGIFYRVRVPAASPQEANMICTNVKAAGGDCFVM